MFMFPIYFNNVFEYQKMNLKFQNSKKSFTVTVRASSRLPKCTKKTFSNDGIPPQEKKLNLPIFGDIVYRLRQPEVSHFRSNRFDHGEKRYENGNFVMERT